MKPDVLKQKLDEFSAYMDPHCIRSFWMSAIELWKAELDKKENGESYEQEKA